MFFVSFFSGSRNWHYGSVSGSRNWHYGRAELYVSNSSLKWPTLFFLGRVLARAPISGFWLHPPPPSHSSHPPPPSHSSHFNIRLNDQAYNCLIHFYKIDYHDNLRWKMTLDWRRLSMEDGIWWRTAFGGRKPLAQNFALEFKVCHLAN